MAGKFIELKDAAKQLGVSSDRLLEMREAGDIHGYRDGASWKFKPEEVERVAAELSALDAAGNGDLSLSDSGPLSGDDFDSLLDVNVDLDSDSIGNGEGSSILISDEEKKNGVSGTSIGKEKSAKNGHGAAELKPAAGDDEDNLEVDSDADFQLADDEEGSSDEESDLDLADELHFESEDALALSDDSSVSAADTPPNSLANPADSGLSLELDSDDDSAIDSLEMPQDSDMLSIDEGLPTSPDDATQLQQDEEFILSPSDEMLGDESSDSGSQVIALDDSEAFEDSDDLGDLGDAEPISLVEDAEISDAGLEPFEGELAETTVQMADVGGLPEAPFSAWNVISLLLVVLLLSVIGMLMTDVIRNMWTWNETVAGSGGLADAIVGMLGMDK